MLVCWYAWQLSSGQLTLADLSCWHSRYSAQCADTLCSGSVLTAVCWCCLSADRLFTTGEVGVTASAHIPNTDYSAVVQKALEMPGFSYEPEPKFVTVGFGHQTTLGAACKTLD